MSSDRILRVRQLMSFPDSRKLVVKSVEKRPIVRIGDWCIFKTLPGPQREYLFLLGRDLQFNSFADSKQKSIYEWQSSSEKKNDEIGVNCTWYTFEGQVKGSRKISTIGKKLAVIVHRFHPCKTYVCSLPPPTIPSCQMISYPDNVVCDVTPFLSKVK